MKVPEGRRTATLADTPESYVVASTAFGHVLDVIAEFDVKTLAREGAAKRALAKRDELREQDIVARRAGKRTVEALAVVHDCDENAVPYVSDGPLGHGWECGRCGKFLQAG